jgi:hypothetical protein
MAERSPIPMAQQRRLLRVHQPADAAKTDAVPAKDGTHNAATEDNQKESTSKKKKGLRKLVPW